MTIVPAAGVRRPWQDVPDELRDAIESHMGAKVTRAVTQSGGFSPGVAARLLFQDGSRAFVKAVGPTPNPHSPDIHRSEARVAALLPPQVPAPRLLASFDLDGWVALLFQDIDGRQPAQPWRADELTRVLDALDEMATRLTPSPIAVPSAYERLTGMFENWRTVAAARDAGEDDLADLGPWVAAHLDDLAELESRWPAATEGDSLVHGDIRADNLLLTDDEVFVVDWPHAFLGPRWFDVVAMLPSVRMQGGPPPEEVIAGHRVAREADPAALTALLAAFAGYFACQSRLPAPPGLPTLRAFQHAQGQAALEWLRTRTTWP
ncbi:aminoglycoside phosphotransferase family protein [Sphaerisporangium rhizosphaerae]|uniref:Aminoglycoside phosphotransferase family protein n=1 Tax=Sphaerisporangium rhizosphaerae TaxID=2269375 RepID=A0ABW2PAW8_9ACTN